LESQGSLASMIESLGSEKLMPWNYSWRMQGRAWFCPNCLLSITTTTSTTAGRLCEDVWKLFEGGGFDENSHDSLGAGEWIMWVGTIQKERERLRADRSDAWVTKNGSTQAATLSGSPMSPMNVRSFESPWSSSVAEWTLVELLFLCCICSFDTLCQAATAAVAKYANFCQIYVW